MLSTREYDNPSYYKTIIRAVKLQEKCLRKRASTVIKLFSMVKHTPEEIFIPYGAYETGFRCYSQLEMLGVTINGLNEISASFSEA